jgi:hypothetical protein
MGGAPVRILGWDNEQEVWLAERDGEPSYKWVQDFGDAYYSCLARDVELHVPASIYAEWVRGGEAPAEPLGAVRIIDR